MFQGLLGSSWEDPKSAANMALAAGLLGGSLRKGLIGSSEAYQNASSNALRTKAAQMQMEEAQARMQEQAQQRAFLQNLQPLSGGDAANPQQQMMFQGVKAGAIPLATYLTSLQKDESPLTVAPGASLVDRRTMKPIFTAPKEEATPAAIREYQFAQQQGYKGTFEQWDMARKKAGGTNVNVAVSTEKNLLGDIAGGLGKSIVGARDSAQSALGTIGTVNRLNDALDSGQVMAGPGTTFRQYGLQVGSMLGVGGKDAQEKLLNTRQAIQSLAQLELDAAQQMKGQGQITEAERSIIRRAASGDIDGMTANELRLLGGVLDRTARSKIRGYNQQVKPLASNPNAAPLAPFLNVEEPPERKGAGGIRRFNPATGKIE